MEIGQAIRLLRKQKGLTQEQFAQLIKVSYSSVCWMERGRSFPHKSTMDLICKSLDIPLSYLMLLSLTKEEVPEDMRKAFEEQFIPFRNKLITKI